MGHYCVRMAGRDRTYMFSSDCVFWGGAIILQNVKDSNVQEYAASCNKIAALEWDALLRPPHDLASQRAPTRRGRGERVQPHRPPEGPPSLVEDACAPMADASRTGRTARS